MNKLIRVFNPAMGICQSKSALPPPPPSPPVSKPLVQPLMGRWNARVTHVYDGDTFTATIENGPHQGLSIKVRVIGFNSEEIKDKRY